MNLSVYFVTPEAEWARVETLVLAAVKGGATIVQLRDKTGSDAEMIGHARSLHALLAPLGVPLIINDRVEVMLESQADGLHVGQSDASAARMRERIGPDRILGLSIETEEQLARLPADCVDYIGVGPVRSTASKANHAVPLGFDGLARIVGAATVPAVAIGGLTIEDIPALKRMGAAGLAVISAIAGADNPEKAARALVSTWGRT